MICRWAGGWLKCMLFLALACGVANAAVERRIALVIGNETYQHANKLANPVRDVKLIAEVLERLGFKVVRVFDVGKRDMELALARFNEESVGAQVAFLYYSGHGMQPSKGGKSFLLPVNANVANDHELEADGVSVERIVEELEQMRHPARVRVVVLDACRNSPFGRRVKGGIDGLAPVRPGDQFTLVAFATQEGNVASDGEGGNSPYARSLAKWLGQARSLPLRRVFERTADEVKAATSQFQIPRTYGDLPSDVSLFGGIQAASSTESDGEAEAWLATGTAASIPAYEAFLDAYPVGRYAVAAKINLGALRRRAAEVAALSNGQTGSSAEAPHPELVPQTLISAVAGQGERLPGTTFRDCDGCPEMVVIPDGGFDERWLRPILVRSFAIGRTEVTQRQWKAVMGNNPSVFKACGEDCPVENLTWDDAKTFIWMLNLKISGRMYEPYRLPSDTEWEYTCREGGRNEYCGGDDVAAVAWYADNSDRTTHRVATKAANRFGIHDLSGNVREWVEDCYSARDSEAPTGGTAVSIINCSKRYVRGGSWFNDAADLRSIVRDRNDQSLRSGELGFRVARTLP